MTEQKKYKNVCQDACQDKCPLKSLDLSDRQRARGILNLLVKWQMPAFEGRLPIDNIPGMVADECSVLGDEWKVSSAIQTVIAQTIARYAAQECILDRDLVTEKMNS